MKDVTMQPIRKGSIAVCSRGMLGLVLSDGLVEVTYPDGNKGQAWTGIQLSGELLGAPWSSRTPKAVSHIELHDLRDVGVELHDLRDVGVELHDLRDVERND